METQQLVLSDEPTPRAPLAGGWELPLVWGEFVVNPINRQGLAPMTSLAIALAVDARGPSALYIITDSRITWRGSSGRWDGARKTFASQHADIFGFCGDGFFPPVILQQVLLQSSLGLLYDKAADSLTRHTIVMDAIRRTLKNAVNAPIDSFSLFHGTRDGEGMGSQFLLWDIHYYPMLDKLESRRIDLTTQQSYLVHVAGTGDNVIMEKATAWAGSKAHGTSRAAIASFCDALRSGVDIRSGGAPQLVGLWRIGTARTFGFIWNSRKYVSGLELPPTAKWDQVGWFNENFERCDGGTGLRMKGAQEHIRPEFA